MEDKSNIGLLEMQEKNKIGFFLHLSVGFRIGLQLEVSSIGINKLKPSSVRTSLSLKTDAAATIGVSLKTHNR